MAALSRLGPPLLLMGVIFFLSAQPNLGTDLGLIDTIGRKIVHMVEFGLLCLLWWRALGFTPAALIGAALIAVAYGASDEFHQSFVEGRKGAPSDVAIDAAGVGIACAVALRRLRPARASRAR